MKSKSGKKISFTSESGKFKINGGAVTNYKKPRSVYVKMTSWLSFTEKVDNVNLILKEYRRAIRNYLHSSELIREHFNYSTIVDINISESRVKLNKVTFFELDITFYQKDMENPLPLVAPKNKEVPNLYPILDEIVKGILGLDVFTNNEYFEYHYQKKDAKKIFDLETC